MIVCRIILSIQFDNKLTTTIVTCLIGFVNLTLSVLAVVSLTREPSTAPYGDILRPLCKTYVSIGFPDRLEHLFNVYLDVLKGYVGYHSWDVTIGQVAASDFYMASNVLAHGFKGNADVQGRSLTYSN